MLQTLGTIEQVDATLTKYHKVVICYSTPLAAEATKTTESELDNFRKSFPEIHFFSVNIDAIPAIVDREQVAGTPTVQGYFRGVQFGDGVADSAKIEDLLRELNFQPEQEE